MKTVLYICINCGKVFVERNYSPDPWAITGCPNCGNMAKIAKVDENGYLYIEED